MSDWKMYKRLGAIEARPWTESDLCQYMLGNSPVSVSDADLRGINVIDSGNAGMVARNPANHADQWYIAPDYFAKHYAASTPPAPDAVTDCQPKPSEGTVSERECEVLFAHCGPENTLPMQPEKRAGYYLLKQLTQARATIERQARDYAAALESIRAEMIDAERKHAERISQLEADLAAARLNERRYLWLRENHNSDALIRMGPGAFQYEYLHGEELDAAIDLAAGDGK